MNKLISTMGALALAAIAFAAEDRAPALYLAPERPIDKRVEDLVSRMTLEEKASQMFHGAPAIKRLGVPELKGWNQCLRGVVWNRPTTMFPVAIAQAATWNPQLVHQVATAISDEARAIHNLGLAGQAERKGLFYRAPVINISRDPRWGRIEECFGEDPLLTSRIAVEFVKGLQGDDPKYLKLVSTLKHYAVNNQEKDRTSLSAEVPQRMLMEYWLPHFRACIVEGKAQSIMAAYNAINGVPCAVNKLLLTDILRGQWGFEGFVVSDTGGIERLVLGHRLTKTYEEAAAKAILAGCDLDDKEFPQYVPNAVRQGLVSEEAVDRAVGRIFRARFRLGEFDPPDRVPYSRISADAIDSAAHRELALRAARESIVLLSNRDGFLPLDRQKTKSIAVIGPQAAVFTAGCRNYTGLASKTVNPLQGIRNRAGAAVQIVHAPGCDLLKTDGQDAATQQAADAAAKCDVAIVFVGTNSQVENEGRDRTSIGLPGAQENLVKAVHKANPRTVLVMINAGPLSIRWAKDNVPAIIEAWFNGEESGNAIADVLFGDYNPAGRLPFTVYESLDRIPPQSEYDITKGFTYMYFKGQALFPFGHGLSYTRFKYGNVRITPGRIRFDGSVANAVITLDVENVSDRDGDEVVQLYTHAVTPSVIRPIRQLMDFQRIHLKHGETKTVRFSLPADRLAFYDASAHRFRVESGRYDILIGSSSEDIRAQGQIEIATP